MIVALWADAAGPTRLPSTEQSVDHLIDRDPDALNVAVDGDQIVGSLISGWDGWRFHLYRLAVSPTCRRKGIAAALVKHARARAKVVGARRLDAMVDTDNQTAHAFWASAGFECGPGDDRRWSAAV